MGEAVSGIRPGQSVAMGLALEHAVPFAAGHEMIRQGTGNLTLVGPISDMLFDHLIGAGLVSRVRAAWVGNVSTGSAYRFREAVESGRLEVEDHSNLSVALALEAGAMGVPFLPTRSLLGSDILSGNSSLVEQESPIGEGRVVLVPALAPDWTVIHVQRATRFGEAELRGSRGIVEPAVAAASRVLVTTEEVVESAALGLDSDRVVATREEVTAVVECPLGAHPSPLAGRYDREHDVYLDYAERTRTREGWEEWAAEWVYGVSGRAEYARRVGE